MTATEKYYYQSLFEIAAAINSTLTRDIVLQTIVEKITKTMWAKGCSVILLSPDKKELLHTAAYGLSDWYIKKGPLSADKSISEALQGKVVAVLNAPEDDRVQYQEEKKKEGIVSILSVPMTLRQEIIGVIRVYTSKTYQFTSDDTYFVGAVANLAAIALENARFIESVRKGNEALRKELLEWRKAMGDWPPRLAYRR